jgi:hypothetical protein
MKSRTLYVCLALLLPLVSACTRATDEAERRYAIVEKSGSAKDLCAEGEKLVQAYLAASDSELYRERKAETEIACENRRSREEDGYFRMPNGTERHITADVM